MRGFCLRSRRKGNLNAAELKQLVFMKQGWSVKCSCYQLSGIIKWRKSMVVFVKWAISQIKMVGGGRVSPKEYITHIEF